MFSVTKEFTFDAAHRVLGHGALCKYLHGHTYRVQAEVRSHRLNNLGMVIDFADIKDVVGKFIKEQWDHNIILNSNDPVLDYLVHNEARMPYVLIDRNPTAEEMAKELWTHCNLQMPDGSELAHIRIYETPTSWADFNPEHIASR